MRTPAELQREIPTIRAATPLGGLRAASLGGGAAVAIAFVPALLLANRRWQVASAAPWARGRPGCGSQPMT
jgi:hypothetical protein